MKIKNIDTDETVECLGVAWISDPALWEELKNDITKGGTYESLDSMYDEWEEVPGPVIKDAKMRDLVMTWAKTMGIAEVKGIVYDDGYKDKYTALFGSRDGDRKPYPRTYQLDMPYKLDMLEETPYSIEELCGEGAR